MDVTPGAIKRLKRLASLIPKTAGGTPRIAEKRQKDWDGQDAINNFLTINKIHHRSPSDSLSDRKTSSQLVNCTNYDPTSQDTLETSDDVETVSMDTNTFHQILKEVIKKRAFLMEEKLLADFDKLKNQVSELETQKKRLQSDSERLKQTLNEITSTFQKPAMKSCATQVDIDLLPQRSMSPEISKPTKPPSIPLESLSTKRTQTTENGPQYHRVETIQCDQEVADTMKKTFEPPKAVASSTTETIVLSNRHETTAREKGLIVGKSDTLKQLTEVEMETTKRLSQEQRTNEESLLTDDYQIGPQKIPIESPQLNCSHSSKVSVEVPLVSQDTSKVYDNETLGVTRVEPVIHQVSSNNQPITSVHQGCSPESLTIRQPFSSSQWTFSQQQLSPQPSQVLRASGFETVGPQTCTSAIQGNVNRQADHCSTVALSGGPKNLSLPRPSKRKRVYNDQDSKGLQMHVVSSSSSYIMHNFKIQRSHSHLGDRSGSSVGAPRNASQALATNSLSNPSNTFSFSSLRPASLRTNPSIYPEQDRPSNRSAVGLSQGEFVERVFYPSNPPRESTIEHQSNPRPLKIVVHRRRSTNDKSGEPVNVIQGYQVTEREALLRKQNAPASSVVQRSPVYTPVQSATLPSGYLPCELNTTFVPCNSSYHIDTSSNRIDYVQTLVKTLPKPTASIAVVDEGIVLSWNLRPCDNSPTSIDNYELFACQDGAQSATPPIMWRKIGIVKALPLPMACTLSQFSSGNKYHFAVRAVDESECAGPFSDPCSISLTT